MNKYVKDFIHRGLIFGGFGPIVTGIVMFILDLSGVDLALSGGSLLLAIVSTYIVAFVHAGTSVFPQIESWSKIKAMFFQLICIYTVYTVAYLINRWILWNSIVLLIYTCCFVGFFFLVWGIILLSAKQASKRLNEKLKEINKENAGA